MDALFIVGVMVSALFLWFVVVTVIDNLCSEIRKATDRRVQRMDQAHLKRQTSLHVKAARKGSRCDSIGVNDEPKKDGK